MTLLSDGHAIVTGGATGIGAAIARALSDQGARVTLMARSADKLKAAATDLPHAQAVPCDITDYSAVEVAFDQACAAFGPPTILINNAGAAATAPVHKTSTDLWNSMIAVNLTGTFFCTRAALNRMDRSVAGRIIMVASTSALRGYAYTAAYAAAKHGVLGLVRSTALELAQTNITVNAVCPGFTDTDIVGSAVDNIAQKTGRTQAEALAELTKHNPQGRLIQPSEIAETCVWLCQENAASVHGQAIAVAGGEVM